MANYQAPINYYGYQNGQYIPVISQQPSYGQNASPDANFIIDRPTDQGGGGAYSGAVYSGGPASGYNLFRAAPQQATGPGGNQGSPFGPIGGVPLGGGQIGGGASTPIIPSYGNTIPTPSGYQPNTTAPTQNFNIPHYNSVPQNAKAGQGSGLPPSPPQGGLAISPQALMAAQTQGQPIPQASQPQQPPKAGQGGGLPQQGITPQTNNQAPPSPLQGILGGSQGPK